MLNWLLVKGGRRFLCMDHLSPLILPGKPLESVTCPPVLFFPSTPQDKMAPEEIMT